MPKIFKDKNNNVLYTGYETSEVVANPTLAGTEVNLTGLQVGDTKFAVPQGGRDEGYTLTVTNKSSTDNGVFYILRKVNGAITCTKETISNDSVPVQFQNVYAFIPDFYHSFGNDDFISSQSTYALTLNGFYVIEDPSFTPSGGQGYETLVLTSDYEIEISHDTI